MLPRLRQAGALVTAAAAAARAGPSAASAWPATGGAAAAAGRVCDAGGAATPALSAPLWGRSSRGFTASSAALATVRPPPRDDAPAKQSFLSPYQAPNWGCAGGGMSPFTFTKDLVKRKNYFKRTAYIMQTLEYEASAKIVAARPKPFPAFRPGDVLNLKLVVPENKRRPAEFKGLCIARRNRGLGSSFTLRAVLNNHAVERMFPLYSPHILDMEVTERRKVARAKLYYLRNKPLKMSRVGTGGGAAAAEAAAAGGDEDEVEEKRGTRRKPTGAEVANAAARKAAKAKAKAKDAE